MYAEAVWALASSGTQFQLQIILDPDYLPHYPYVSYDYDTMNSSNVKINFQQGLWGLKTCFRPVGPKRLSNP